MLPPGPKPWPKSPDVLGKDAQRVDARAKVTGAAHYASDQQPPGWLYGMILRSKWPAAKITAVNLDKAKAIPGVKAIILASNIPGTVRYYGQEVAAIAATSKQACQDALRAIEVTAEALPFVVKEDDAVRPDSPQVFDKQPNLSPPGLKEEGKIDEALAAAAGVVEGELRTPTQMHHPLEAHGNTVWVEGDHATAWASTQGVFSVKDGLAGHLGLDQSKARAICDYMGGGFGSKFGLGAEGALAATLSKETGLPVKIILTRLDEGLAVGNRPSSIQKLKLAGDAEGKLTVFTAEVVGSPGVSTGGSTAGGSGGARAAVPYIYQPKNFRVQQQSVALNAGASRAFRAPAHPQGAFSTDSMMDELAIKLNIDPVEMRLKNDPSSTRRQEYEAGRDRIGWKEKYKKPGSSPGPIKTGLGCGGASWGGGGKGTQAQVTINPDGTVEVRCGTQDLGTGSRTIVAMIAAEAFGLKVEQVVALIGDTNFPPSGASGGSTTTASVAPAIWDACQNALTDLKTRSGLDDVRGANWKAACAKLGINPLVAQGKWQEGLSGNGCGGVQFAEVEVDTETGFVKVKKIVAVMDCGFILNPLTTTSQVNGGVMLGLGYALYEERVMDRGSGLLLNVNFDTYKIPSLADTPEIEVILVNQPDRGVIGNAEVSNVPTASAVANAVANALGVRIWSLPITPAKVLAALGKVPKFQKTATA